MTPTRTANRRRKGGFIELRAVPVIYQLNVAFGVLGAAVVRLLATRPMALAVLGTLPVTLLRTWLLRTGMERSASTGSIVGRAMVRMMLSLGALTVGALLGAELLLGVLIGLCMELFAYVVVSLRLARDDRV